MDNIGYIQNIKEDHRELFKGILEFEGMINKRMLNYFHLIHSFHKLLVLISKHGKNQQSALAFLPNDSPVDSISLDSKHISGHIIVINRSLISKDVKNIRLALDNDGRMLISRIKEHIFREEMILDRVLFLRMSH